MEWCSHCSSYVDPGLAVTKSMKHVLRQCPQCGKILPDCEIEVPGMSKRRSMTIREKSRRTHKPKLRKTDDAGGESQPRRKRGGCQKSILDHVEGSS